MKTNEIQHSYRSKVVMRRFENLWVGSVFGFFEPETVVSVSVFKKIGFYKQVFKSVVF